MTEETTFYVMPGVDGWQVLSQEEYDPERIYHVKSRDGNWIVEKEWAGRPSNVLDKKAPAVARGKELAKRNEALLMVHKKDGDLDRRYDFRSGSPAA